ncbi:MAG TPA: hypothetical protein VEQ85_16635, partial [Lacipirellulaceae bacterium]|nr:hypothetical protein [Lacipirellulaceae bacterium]
MIKAPGLAAGIYDQPVTMYDIMPTVVAAAGGTSPAGQTDGVNLLPHLSGANASAPHESLYFRNNSVWAIRQGDWKLGRMNSAGSITMYNVATNPSENINVLNTQAALAAEMTKDFTKWEAGMAKPEFGGLGADDRNRFDHFTYRVDQAASANWNGASMWTEGGVPAHNVTLTSEDAYANLELEFGVRQTADYTATNNMLRVTGLTFMANQLQFTGTFNGAANRSATINGNPVLMVKNLAGGAPRLHLAANAAGANGFTFNIHNELQLLDNLEITGNGTQTFNLHSPIKDYDEPRSVTKLGASTLNLRGASTFGGTLAVNAGRVRLDAAAGSIIGASSITIGAGAAFDMNDGQINTPLIDVAAGGSLTFDPTGLAAGDVQASLVNRGSVDLTSATPAVLNVTGGLVQLAGGSLGIRAARQGATTLVDKIQLTGGAQLGGMLDLDILNLGQGLVTPAPGLTLQVLSAAGGVAGKFASADLPTAPNGLGWEIVYAPTTVSLRAVLNADFNNDGAVTGADLITWRSGYGATTGATRLTGDADSDGDVDGSDFSVWQRTLGFTNPAALASVGAVPEPAGAILLLAAMVAAAPVAHRRRGGT